jgi:ApbE superfamily uncharacterized protein (UPF0280 family)
MERPQAHILPDGARLHLSHGPIDLIVGADADARSDVFEVAVDRFQSVLAPLADELPELRSSDRSDWTFHDPIAQRMAQAVRPFSDRFVTPMAAVAGAVADEVRDAVLAHIIPLKLYVNNGGDVSVFAANDQELRLASAAGEIEVKAGSGIGGVATSGWRGRSFSLGIADAVTVLAASAAEADVAATLIANAIDLPGHKDVARVAARMLAPDSDLTDQRVTTDVGVLSAHDIETALEAGLQYARELVDKNLIFDATCMLQNTVRTARGVQKSYPTRRLVHA